MRNKSKLRDQNEKASAVKFATRRKKGFGGGGRKHVKWASEWPVYSAPMYGDSTDDVDVPRASNILRCSSFTLKQFTFVSPASTVHSLPFMSRASHE